MKKIRLAIVRQKFCPYGGAELFISRSLQALSNSSLELNIITRQWCIQPHSNYYVHIRNPKKWCRISRERNFAIEAKRFWEEQQFDLVQSHERISGCDVFRAGDGVHQAWLEQRSRVIPGYLRQITSLSLYHNYVLRSEKDMFRSKKLKKIICNSSMVRKDIMEYYDIKENKLELIYNAIDPLQFYPANSEQRQKSREKLLISKKACVLIYVGSGFVRKGLKQAIIAISNTDRYLIIVGKDKNQDKYLALAKSIGCLSRLRFVGVKKDILPYYHASDALILPSLYDPFPNVILEAMSCELPVITSERCGGAEFIEQGKQGFVCDALDTTSLSEFVSLISPIELRPEMGKLARDRIKNHTPFMLSHQLIKLYKKLIL